MSYDESDKEKQNNFKMGQNDNNAALKLTKKQLDSRPKNLGSIGQLNEDLSKTKLPLETISLGGRKFRTRRRQKSRGRQRSKGRGRGRQRSRGRSRERGRQRSRSRR